MSNLPPLPEPAQVSYVNDSAMRSLMVRSYTERQMTAYAEQARASILQAEHELSDSYVRIREIVGAMNPPSLNDRDAFFAYVEGCVRNFAEQARAELLADAMRYRWLVNECAAAPKEGGGSPEIRLYGLQGKGDEIWCGEARAQSSLSAAIDAAMKGTA